MKLENDSEKLNGDDDDHDVIHNLPLLNRIGGLHMQDFMEVYNLSTSYDINSFKVSITQRI